MSGFRLGHITGLAFTRKHFYAASMILFKKTNPCHVYEFRTHRSDRASTESLFFVKGTPMCTPNDMSPEETSILLKHESQFQM